MTALQKIGYIPNSRTERAVRDVYNELNTAITEGAIVNLSGAEDYFVDLNVVTSGDGKSWDEAFGTIAEAITASNISIAASYNRWWARRNRIFVCGDGITESLTVLPEKCDIIGVGSDLFPFPRIVGNHTIAAATVSCRFINLGFYTSGTGDLLSLPAGCHGFQSIGCFYHPGTTSTKCLEITDSAHVRIMDNEITVGAGDMAKIFGVGISIEGTTGHDTVIGRNRITGTAGIVIASGITSLGSLIHDNIIRAVALAINDDSDDFQVVNNRWMTDIDTKTSTAGYDFNLQLAAGNIQMGVTGLCDTIPFTKIAE